MMMRIIKCHRTTPPAPLIIINVIQPTFYLFASLFDWMGAFFLCVHALNVVLARSCRTSFKESAYEISALTNKGLPVSGMMKIVCPSDSTYHVESKSIKLYLNSFNMTRFGDSADQCVKLLEEAVAKDLSEKLETDVRVKMFTDETADSFSFQGYTKLGYLCDLDMLLFDTFHSDYKALKTIETHDNAKVFKLQSDLLRSNCRVTNQPDWGDVFIYMEDANEPDYDSLAKYIVSHRKVSHFHEEICEMIFTHFTNAYKPDKLMVACLYTRRGGIDINPIRASHPELLPEAFLDEEIRLRKTLRQ